MTTIPLHKDRGLDPHLTFCIRCGGDSQEITIGEVLKAELPNGQYVYANRGCTKPMVTDLVAQGLIQSGRSLSWEEVVDNEKIPSTNPCDKCLEDLKLQSDEITKGGVYIKCLKCGITGVLKAESDIAKDVRSHSGIEAPNPVGIESQGCNESNGINFEQCTMND